MPLGVISEILADPTGIPPEVHIRNLSDVAIGNPPEVFHGIHSEVSIKSLLELLQEFCLILFPKLPYDIPTELTN